jgi:hypothetical protein
MKLRALFIVTVVAVGLSISPVQAAEEVSILTGPEYQVGYDRSYFKLWVDADKNGCDTRKEVLIAEAITKPKKGSKCTLSGGKWLSPYDNKTYTKDSALDIDHVVPLAEAWRSGAWAWTPQQRQDYANDLSEPRALVAVTSGLNRSKGDKDLSSWLPPKNVCEYVTAWVSVKVRYSLTFDSRELQVAQSYFNSCPITNINVEVLPGFTSKSASPSASPDLSSFKMPIFADRLGAIVAKWSTYGFNKKPIIVQQAPTLKGYSCKPINDNDWLAEQFPKWNTDVNADTQVTLTAMCSIDTNSYQPSPAASASPLPSATSTSGSTNSGAGSSVTPSSSPSPAPIASASPTSSPAPSPTPTATQEATISPGAFCSPAGATGKSSSGVTYTCKTLSTDTRNRWRQ